MKEFKGTRGEWKTGVLGTEVAVGSKPILDVWSFNRSKEETIANFNLVKAAPELLKTLQTIVSDFECDYMVDGVIVDKPDQLLIYMYEAALKAINKALGE